MIQRRRKSSQLHVGLVGPVPSGGLNALGNNVVADCSFFLFPEMKEDKSLLRKLDEADVVIAQYFTENMAHAAKKLKLLHSVGAGVDSFCLSALSPDTTVANVFFHGPAIAEYVLMMVLALSRDLIEVDTQFRKGVWHGSWLCGDRATEEIKGKVLGIIGFGHIGREVASRARAFGMRVRALSGHTPLQKPRGVESWQGPEGLHSLLKESDYVVLACPLTDATRGLIGMRELGLMKPSASLINIARAPIVQEGALYQALHKRQIGGAALDVWYRHPARKQVSLPSRYPFHKLRNLIMTPHIAGWTQGTFEQRYRAIAGNIDRLISNRPLINVVQGPVQHKLEKVRNE